MILQSYDAYEIRDISKYPSLLKCNVECPMKSNSASNIFYVNHTKICTPKYTCTYISRCHNI